MKDGIAAIYNGITTAFGLSSNYYEKILLSAAATGDTEKAKSALNNGKIEINYDKGPNKDTALHQGAENGHIEIVKLLLENQGIKLDQQNINLETPLHKAVEHNHADIVLLLANETSLNIPNKDGFTPLALLIMKGKLDIIIKYVQLNDISIAHYNNVILQAIELKRIDLALGLIKQASRNIEINKSQWFEAAVKLGDPNAVAALFEHFNLTESQLNKLLNTSVIINKNDVAKVLLLNGACANNESSPLLFAAQKGYTDLLKTLLQAGAKLDAHDIDGNNVLHLSIKGLHLDTFKNLVNSYMDLSESNVAGQTASDLISLEIASTRQLKNILLEKFSNHLRNATQAKIELSQALNDAVKLLKKEEQILSDKLEKLISMKALLDNAENFKANLLIPRVKSPLKLMPAKSTQSANMQPSSHTFDIYPNLVDEPLTHGQGIHFSQDKRKVGSKSARPAEFDFGAEQPDEKKLKLEDNSTNILPSNNNTSSRSNRNDNSFSANTKVNSSNASANANGKENGSDKRQSPSY
ncbi:MAG: ankyrin repeat domain-containing protein [Proteobacteria bacterium]|nr:ankyrin repeat domain-containing protein [Pseudomonadota bacterium]